MEPHVSREEAYVDEGVLHANVNYTVRFGFSPPGWQRPGSVEEADENRSGGDPLSRSTSSFSSGDESIPEISEQEVRAQEQDADELNTQAGKTAVCWEEGDENQEKGFEAKKPNQLADTSFASTSASGPASFASRSSFGGSCQSEASLGSFAPKAGAAFPQAPTGYSRFTPGDSGPLLDVEIAAHGNAEAVRPCAAWRVAVPVIAFACAVGGGAFLLSQ